MCGEKVLDWSNIQIPTPLLRQVEEVIKDFPYWIGSPEFIRDAVREKIERLRLQSINAQVVEAKKEVS